MFMAISLIEFVFNPHSNMYEQIQYPEPEWM